MDYRNWRIDAGIGLPSGRRQHDVTDSRKVALWGSLALSNGGVRTLAQRPEAGVLSVELTDLLPNQRLNLTVQLGHDDRITFSIMPKV